MDNERSKSETKMSSVVYCEIFQSNYYCDICQYMILHKILKLVNYIKYIIQILPIKFIYITCNKKFTYKITIYIIFQLKLNLDLTNLRVTP